MGGGALAVFLPIDGPPGEHVAVLVENGFELGLTLAHTADGGLFHGVP